MKKVSYKILFGATLCAFALHTNAHAGLVDSNVVINIAADKKAIVDNADYISSAEGMTIIKKGDGNLIIQGSQPSMNGSVEIQEGEITIDAASSLGFFPNASVATLNGGALVFSADFSSESEVSLIEMPLNIKSDSQIKVLCEEVGFNKGLKFTHVSGECLLDILADEISPKKLILSTPYVMSDGGESHSVNLKENVILEVQASAVVQNLNMAQKSVISVAGGTLEDPILLPPIVCSL